MGGGVSSHPKPSYGKRIPLPGFGVPPRRSFTGFVTRHGPAASELSADAVKAFLIMHPEFYNDFTVDAISSNCLETLLEKKRSVEKHRTDHGYRCPMIQTQYCDVKVLNRCEDILKLSCDDMLDTNVLLNELSHILAGALKADGFTLYIPEEDDTELYVYQDNGEKKLFGPVGLGTTVAAHTAVEKQTLLIKDLATDVRFPKGVGRPDYECHSVICVPLILPSHDLIGLMEYTRDDTKEPFAELELQTVNSMVSWVVVSLHEFQLNRILTTQTKMNDFLLGTTRIMFDDMISIDTLIQNIMMYTKDLVHADRSALFLVDEEKNEIYADYFDEGKLDDLGKPLFEKKNQIRFSIEKGIAGHVAKTGKSVNIHDAYKDPRFNPDIDKSTGYKTRNILCMPICCKDKVIGVIQLLNRLSGHHFTGGDESAFKTFAVYCALALHYSKLYSLLKHQQDRYQVALELLGFHQSCSEEEYKDLLAMVPIKPHNVPKDIDMFDFYACPYESKLAQLFVHMVIDMFDDSCFDINKLCHFTLTIRKNYRPVKYHNWIHGFHVAHTVYCTLKTNPNLITEKEAQAMLIAAICHDVDHRGYNNAFFQKTNQPLAALYSTSVMEQHHYKQTVTILQQKGNEIFGCLSPEFYKDMLEKIRIAIISTDLALYFGNQKKLASMVKEGTVDLTNPETRENVKALIMTASDLSGVCKPWATQQTTAALVYEEFYIQGDEEKKRGLEVLPMMDRDKKDEMPKQQVGFLQFVCSPCYQTLYDILPSTKPLLDCCKANLEMWKQVMNETQK